jgi:enterochelin esterase-like enzyme
VPRAREAIVDAIHLPARTWTAAQTIRGPNAVPAPPRALPLVGRLETFLLESKTLGGKRTITVYVPPEVGSREQLPVIYLADGGAQTFGSLAEAAARMGRARRAIIVGIESDNSDVTDCRASICNRRTLDYLIDVEGPGPGTYFSRHLSFVTDELIPLIERRFPASPLREDRITAGYSNGGGWALAAAEVRPDLFGSVLAMSSGSRAAAASAGRLQNTRLFAGAGLFEPPFLRRTREAAENARLAGAEVRFREMVAGHSQAMWEVLFVEGIAWLLPPAA